SILHGNPDIPIYTGAVSPKGVQCAAEVADGCFMVWMNPERFDVFRPALQAGFAKAGNGKTMAGFDFAPFVRIAMGEDLDQCRMKVKHHLALYVGGMGARAKNFYNDYTKRLGYEDAALTVQNLYLKGQKHEAAAAIPDEYVDEVALVGPPARIKDQLERWREAGNRGEVGTMVLSAQSVEELRLVAETLL
ncbi:MAG: LLM class flavin-dependent oxidoreductase, partial [Pseudomonadota bacterium]